MREVEDLLAELKEKYQQDRGRTKHQFAYAPTYCSYCGGYRVILIGSKIDGHAVCIVSDDFKNYFIALMKDVRVSARSAATFLGISQNVVRAWLAWGRKVRVRKVGRLLVHPGPVLRD